MWKFISDRIQAEPVLFQAVIQAAIALLIAFGLHLSSEQMAALLTFTAAVLGFWTRQQVTPINPPKP